MLAGDSMPFEVFMGHPLWLTLDKIQSHFIVIEVRATEIFCDPETPEDCKDPLDVSGRLF
jgi:hypothetical protein